MPALSLTALGVTTKDWAAFARGVQVSTNEHGFESLQGFIDLTKYEASQFGQRAVTLVLSDGVNTIFEGRLEDSTRDVLGGLEANALGKWRTFSDAPYNAFWRSETSAGWIVIPDDDQPTFAPEKYVIDIFNRLYIAPKKGLIYFEGADAGNLSFAIPHQSALPIQEFSFDYDLTADTNRWVFMVLSSDWEPSSATTVENTIASINGTLTGSVTLTFDPAGVERLFIVMCVDPPGGGGSITYAGETGETYIKLTNLEITSYLTADIPTLTGDDITKDVITSISAINSGISSDTSQIQVMPTEIGKRTYEDVTHTDVINDVIKLDDWEARVWDDGILHVNPRGSEGETWYVDADELTVQNSIQPLINSAYAIYTDGLGQTKRTDIANDEDSIRQYSITRRQFIDPKTTNETTAEDYRDALIEANKIPPQRLSLTFSSVFSNTGVAQPLYFVRSGDTIIVRNDDPTNDDISFIVRRTTYDIDIDSLNVEPFAESLKIEELLAQ